MARAVEGRKTVERDASWVVVTAAAELRGILGEPAPRVVAKDRPSLEDIHKQWLASSPFCLVATSGTDGTCDVSPKGDPPGFTLVLDDTTLAIPERPGNRRADGFHNLLTNPHIGLVHLIPGRGDTLRINGTAELVSDADFFDRMIHRGHRPELAVVVHIEQVFFHCSKAFLRADLWDPSSWDPTAVPSRAQIAHLEQPLEPIEDLERYYGAGYSKGLYDASSQRGEAVT
jgi:uncharacterized protein